MRKYIDRAVVRKVIRERLALRKMAQGDFSRIVPGEAFGSDWRFDYLTREAVAKDYLFSITADSHVVRLEVDAYTAKCGPKFAGDSFDVDAWELETIVLTVSPPSRAAYRLMHRTARMVLAGVSVRLPGCDLLPGIQKVED